jgi:hypothetical protein
MVYKKVQSLTEGFFSLLQYDDEPLSGEDVCWDNMGSGLYELGRRSLTTTKLAICLFLQNNSNQAHMNALHSSICDMVSI